jgi:hypothetical protein
MDLPEVGCIGNGLIDQAQDRDMWRTLVNVVMNLWVLQTCGKFLD